MIFLLRKQRSYFLLLLFLIENFLIPLDFFAMSTFCFLEALILFLSTSVTWVLVAVRTVSKNSFLHGLHLTWKACENLNRIRSSSSVTEGKRQRACIQSKQVSHGYTCMFASFIDLLHIPHRCEVLWEWSLSIYCTLERVRHC